jgi:alpha-glucosidase
MKTKLFALILLLLCPVMIYAQKKWSLEVKSPGSSIVLKLESGAKMFWSVQHKGRQIIEPSAISLSLQSGEVLGDNAKISTPKTASKP